MNSHQRRKERREYRYSVPVIAEEYEHYMAMFEWCQKNFGSCVNDGWKDPRWLGDRKWKFNCPKKAAIFSMRWS